MTVGRRAVSFWTTLLPLPSTNADRVEREDSLSARGIYPIWYEGPHDECLLALLDGLR
jgi:hypothetical protein